MPTEADKQAAINAYIEANKIVDDVLIAGGAEKLPKEIEKYATTGGGYYKMESRGINEVMLAGIRISGRTKVTESAAYPVDIDTLRLFVCVDGRHVTVSYPEVGSEPGRLTAAYVLAQRTSAGWRITDYENPEGPQEVMKCSDAR